MSNVLPTGTYYITNVRFDKVAGLQDGTIGTAVAAFAKANTNNLRWDVTLNSGHYTITNLEWSTNFAYVLPQSREGTHVWGNSNSTQWNIVETGVRGQFKEFAVYVSPGMLTTHADMQ